MSRDLKVTLVLSSVWFLKHCRAGEWGGAKGENCYKEKDQIIEEGYSGNGSVPKMMQVVENVLQDLKTRGLKVEMLNITQLSEYRKEGHPSIYRKQWEPLTEEEMSNPKSYADCIHWCLPGVPDTWNELLYAYVFSRWHKIWYCKVLHKNIDCLISISIQRVLMC